jgi:hypothetical protein
MNDLEHNLEYLLKRIAINIQEGKNYDLIGEYVAIYLLRLQVKSRNVEY